MDQQLGLLKQSVDELKQKGIHKQEAKVESDYKKFMQMEPKSEMSQWLRTNIAPLSQY
jgi:hypothetical protein